MGGRVRFYESRGPRLRAAGRVALDKRKGSVKQKLSLSMPGGIVILVKLRRRRPTKK